MRSLTILTSLLLAASLSTQASYTTFGTGCAGTGSTTKLRFGQNQSGGTFRFQSQNSFHFALKFTPTSGRVMTGFDLYTRTKTAASASFATQVFAADSAGRPVNPALRSSTVQVGSKVAFYRTSFAPLQLKAGKSYFVAYHGNRQVYFPHILKAKTSQHYWRRSSTASWSGPWTNPYWSWRVVCVQSGAVPALSSSKLPMIGNKFSVDLTGAAPKTAAIFLLGAAQTKIDLSPFGAKSCSLLTAPIMMWAHPTSSSGKATTEISIPQHKSLRGVKFINQWVIYDPKANNLQLVLSNGGAGVIG